MKHRKHYNGSELIVILKRYKKAEIAVVRFENEDIITASSDSPTDPGGVGWEEEEEGW